LQHPAILKPILAEFASSARKARILSWTSRMLWTSGKSWNTTQLNALTENRRSILHIVFCLGAGICLCIFTIIWLHTPPPKTHQLRPLMKEIDDYKAANGHYPTSCEQFASFAKLTNQFSIYSVYSEPVGKGSILLAEDVSGWDMVEHDFTILLMPDGYKIFFPIAGTERNHAFSFDFSAWRYDSKKGNWRKGRIYDSSFGPYWKQNSFP
jgi:hypothetical protein